jgi:hypothetical protein
MQSGHLRPGRALQLRDALGVVVTRTGIAACWAIVDSYSRLLAAGNLSVPHR